MARAWRWNPRAKLARTNNAGITVARALVRHCGYRGVRTKAFRKAVPGDEVSRGLRVLYFTTNTHGEVTSCSGALVTNASDTASPFLVTSFSDEDPSCNCLH